MSNKKKPTPEMFCNEPAMVEELYTGYLVKSPCQSALSKNTKSWRRRFFVLSKTSEDTYQLIYHTNNERRDKHLGEIDLSKINLLFIGPEAHQKWDWIQKNFKCSPSSVLFLNMEENTPKHSRDYFLIAENSEDVNGWFSALFEVMMKTQQSRNTLQDDRFRSASQPTRLDFSKVKDRLSAPELIHLSCYRNYDYPRKLREHPVPIPVIENTDEEVEKQDEFSENSSVYMSMASVEDHNHSKQSVSFNGNCVSAVLDNRESVTGTSEDSLMDCVTEDFNDMKTLETDGQSEDHRDFKKSINFSGNCASTELDNSETHTYVENKICVSQNDQKNLILKQAESKPCVSQWRQNEDSRGNWIVSRDIVERMHKCLKTLSKDEAKLLVQQFPGLNPEPLFITLRTRYKI